jgi:hypothetical protein
MGHDIKRIADDEWESGNPIDFRGTQTKNGFVQRAWSDWNDEDYLALGVNAMKETGDKSGQFARYNAGTDSRKALDIAHLNLDDYYGSHITGAGLPNKGTAYTYDASALKVLPKDIGKLSTNEQGDIAPPPGGLRPKDYKAHRRSLGLPDIIPTITKPTPAPREVEQEDEEPPELESTDPHAKPPKGEADVMAERMEQASKEASKAGEASVGGISSVAGGDAGGTVRFTKEGETKKDPFFQHRADRSERLETASGRTVETLQTMPKKGTSQSEKARASDDAKTVRSLPITISKEAKEAGEASGSEGEEEGEAGTEATSRAGGGGGGGFKSGHNFGTRKAELEKAFPGIKNGRSNGKEATYGILSTGQKKFMVAIAQGKPGKPSEDLMENYSIDQGEATERQHDYMMKMIDAHDRGAGKKGLTGWATNLTDVAREIPSLTLGKLFSLSPEGRDMVYQSTKSMATGWFNPKLRSLTDHDLDVLLSLYGRVRASPGTAVRGEKLLASGVSKSATEETPGTLGERERRLKAKGYEK